MFQQFVKHTYAITNKYETHVVERKDYRNDFNKNNKF